MPLFDMGQVEPTPTGGHHRSRALFTAVVACAAAWLVPAGSALAFSEPVSGGTTTLALELPKKVSVTAGAPATASGTSLTFPNTGGVVDAARATGRFDLGGAMTLKAKGGKADVTGLKLTIGSAGQISAAVKGEQVSLATVSGGQVQGGSLQATLGGTPAIVTDEGAKALNRQLGKRKKKGKGKAVASKKKKPKKVYHEGDRLGTVSTTATVRTVPVLAQGEALLVPAAPSALTFLSKGVNPVPGFGGIEPVPPAQAVGPDFEFPVSGGRVAPDLSYGQLATAGGLEITKTMGVNASCDAARAVGTFIRQTDLIIDFEKKVLLSTIDSTGGFVGTAIITADLDFPGATITVSPTREVDIQNLGVTLSATSADTINSVFGTAAQGCGSDFQPGDSLGELDVTAQLG